MGAEQKSQKSNKVIYGGFRGFRVVLQLGGGKGIANFRKSHKRININYISLRRLESGASIAFISPLVELIITHPNDHAVLDGNRKKERDA